MEMNRRSAISKMIMTALAVDLAPRMAMGQDAPNQKPAPTPDQWMHGWMQEPQLGRKTTRGEKGLLVVSRFADPMWFLMNPIQWFPENGQQTYKGFTVPKGFITDLASIPQVFWSILPPDGDYAYAAILHDYLYWTQFYPRDQADMILQFVMQDFRVKQWKVDAIYKAVHTFGESAWNDNANLKASGHSRFLAQYPTDPKIRWDEWAKTASNFAANPTVPPAGN